MTDRPEARKQSNQTSSLAGTWRPTATVQMLEARSQVLWEVRSYFNELGYGEVHTPTISRDTVIDRYIDPIGLPGTAIGCSQAANEWYYLQTSPEFGMKRLLAAGMKAIYQIGPAYRAGERGQHHNPEFTMLEWYCVDQSLTDALRFLTDLTDRILQQFACYRQTVYGPAVVRSYASCFLEYLSLDPLECSIQELALAAQQANIELGSLWENQSKDDWLNLLFAECIQPRLGQACPELVTHYPASQAALAQVAQEDRRTSERFELFIAGIEIANGYHELLDANELERRAVDGLHQRRSDGKADLPTHSYLVDAMRHGLPDSCGCALGIDRLVMVALDAKSIDDVIAFPIDRA